MKILPIQQTFIQKNITLSEENNKLPKKTNYTKEYKVAIPNYKNYIPYLNSITFGSNNDEEFLFEQDYPHKFFLKILQEHISDAYTGKDMVTQDELASLKAQNLNGKSSTALKCLKEYKDVMTGTELHIYNMLESLSKKYPKLNIQQLLQLKFDEAENIILNQQSKVMNNIHMEAKHLPNDEYEQVYNLLQDSFKKMYKRDINPLEQFSRKNLINSIYSLKINKNTKTKLIKIAEEIPQARDNTQAFIIKYSKPYKIVYNKQTGEKEIIKRTSKDIAIRLIDPFIATDEHIYPHSLYKKEALARAKGDPEAKRLSKYRVTILTASKINIEKANRSIDDFIKDGHPEIVDNIQKHINQLISIDKKWFQKNRYNDAIQLADYIMVLKKEFDSRSNLIKIDLGNFPNKISKIKAKNTNIISN